MVKKSDPLEPAAGPTWFETDQERIPEDEVRCSRCGRVIKGEPAIPPSGPPNPLCTACAEAG